MSKPIFKDYQSNQEDIKHRIESYGLFDFINSETELLDIGCNQGVFCTILSEHIKNATGIDVVKEHFTTANQIKEEKNIKNCDFIPQDFVTFCQNTKRKFNLIFCFAAHSYIIGTHERCHWDSGEVPMVDFDTFGQYIIDLMTPKGVLIIEGHPTSDKAHKDWEPLMEVLKKQLRLNIIKQGRPGRLLAIFTKDNVLNTLN